MAWKKGTVYVSMKLHYVVGDSFPLCGCNIVYFDLVNPSRHTHENYWVIEVTFINKLSFWDLDIQN